MAKTYQPIFQVQYAATVAVPDHVTPEEAMKVIPLPTEEVEETHLVLEAGSHRLERAEEGQDAM